jgi:hypothetical protein
MVKRLRSAKPDNGLLLSCGKFGLLAVFFAFFLSSISLGEASQSHFSPDQSAGLAIIKLPIGLVEPPRDVAAPDWNSPYCGHWDDGCSECTRAAIDEKPQCNPNNENEGDSSGRECKRRAIICFKEIDPSYFNRICSRYFREEFTNVKNGAVVSTSFAMKVVWEKKDGQFISSRTSLHDRTLALGPVYFLLSDHGYVKFLAPFSGDHKPVGTPFPYGINGIRCTRTYTEGETP